MSKRDFDKKLDKLTKMGMTCRVGILPLIDATKLITASAGAPSAETRQRMRQEYAEREAAPVAEQIADLPEADDSI